MRSSDFNSSPNTRIIRVIRCRRLRQAEHLSRVRNNANARRILLEKLKGKGTMSIGERGLVEWVHLTVKSGGLF
jgi:hypothetical protein